MLFGHLKLVFGLSIVGKILMSPPLGFELTRTGYNLHPLIQYDTNNQNHSYHMPMVSLFNVIVVAGSYHIIYLLLKPTAGIKLILLWVLKYRSEKSIRKDPLSINLMKYRTGIMRRSRKKKDLSCSIVRVRLTYLMTNSQIHILRRW